MDYLPSGKLSHNYGKSPFFMGKSTISMAIFNSYVELPEGRLTNYCVDWHLLVDIARWGYQPVFSLPSNSFHFLIACWHLERVGWLGHLPWYTTYSSL